MKNFKEIEKKWQKKWEEEETFKVTEDKNKKKFYMLVEFPYPSGAGLHVGHARCFTASDVPERVENPEYAQEPELVCQPAHSPDEPPELAGSPAAGAVEPAVFSYLLKIFHYAFLLKFFGQAGR